MVLFSRIVDYGHSISRIYELVKQKYAYLRDIVYVAKKGGVSLVTLDNLFKRMEVKGINARKLSEATGISTGNISDWKNGRSLPTALKLDALASFLDCSVDYLLGRTDCPEVARNPAPATASTIKIAAKGRGAHVIEMEPEQIKALKEALAQLPEE